MQCYCLERVRLVVIAIEPAMSPGNAFTMLNPIGAMSKTFAALHRYLCAWLLLLHWRFSQLFLMHLFVCMYAFICLWLCFDVNFWMSFNSEVAATKVSASAFFHSLFPSVSFYGAFAIFNHCAKLALANFTWSFCS